jgi:hypothetical protein
MGCDWVNKNSNRPKKVCWKGGVTPKSLKNSGLNISFLKNQNHENQ